MVAAHPLAFDALLIGSTTTDQTLDQGEAFAVRHALSSESACCGGKGVTTLAATSVEVA
jgi:hypothetical protein